MNNKKGKNPADSDKSLRRGQCALRASDAVLILQAAAVLCAVIGLASCAREEAVVRVELPPTPVLSVQSNWAIVTSSHLRLREKPDTESKALATLFRGSVLEIISKEPAKDVVEDEENYWYKISYDGLTGWIFGSYIEFFDSKSSAERASRELK